MGESESPSKNKVLFEQKKSHKSLFGLFKWGLLSKTYIELYNYPNQHSAAYHRFYKRIRQLTWKFEKGIISEDCQLDPLQFNILFITFGGIGESLINANFISKFQKKVNSEKVHIDVVDVHRPEIRASIFEALQDAGIRTYGMEFENNFQNYDAIIRIVRYPVILFLNETKLCVVPQLKRYFDAWKVFEGAHRDMIISHPFMDYEGIAHSINAGIKRFQQPDINKLVGVVDLDYPISSGTSEILQKYDLQNIEYITISCDTGFSTGVSTKCWPDTNYKKLLCMFKDRFPGVLTVAIGSSTDSSALSYADLDLRGRTTLNDLKTLLGNARLHISGEGLSVHLRHVVKGGRSIVIFGSTSSAFYGYAENINISEPCSNGPCEWKSKTWATECLLGENPPPCTSKISAERVFAECEKVLCSVPHSVVKD